MRRLRSALTGLQNSVTAPSRAAVRCYFEHLDRVVEGARLDPDDKAMVRREDRQGLGLSRGAPAANTPVAVWPLERDRPNRNRPRA
jgi:hypothetical protein